MARLLVEDVSAGEALQIKAAISGHEKRLQAEYENRKDDELLKSDLRNTMLAHAKIEMAIRRALSALCTEEEQT
jgi:hypothetical protein